MKFLARILPVLAVTACSSPTDAPTNTIPVSFPGGTINASVAATYAARINGLMNVTTLGANSGMLFAFGTDQLSPPNGFYMKDTPTPLSIAFFDSNKTVINIDEMAAETLTPHYAPPAYRYALEANQGWMTAHSVTVGTKVTFALPPGTVPDP